MKRRSKLAVLALLCAGVVVAPATVTQAQGAAEDDASEDATFWYAEEADVRFVSRTGEELVDDVLTLSASLSGENEVSDEGTPGVGDPDGTGDATITIPNDTTVCWSISVQGILLPATAAHIHEGEEGTNGPIVVPLSAPGLDGTSSGCTTADTALIERIAGDPAGFYVNVHNSDFPAGAVRGQLGGGFAAPQPGDRFFLTEDLFASDAEGTKGDAIGHTVIQCTVALAETILCTGTAFLDGRGQVHLSASVPFSETEEGQPFDVAIIGGTGEFADAGGDAVLRDLPPSDDQPSVTLYEVRLQHLKRH